MNFNRVFFVLNHQFFLKKVTTMNPVCICRIVKFQEESQAIPCFNQKLSIWIWGHPHMTSDFFKCFWTYLPTHVRFCPIIGIQFSILCPILANLPTYPKIRRHMWTSPIKTIHHLLLGRYPENFGCFYQILSESLSKKAKNDVTSF